MKKPVNIVNGTDIPIIGANFFLLTISFLIAIPKKYYKRIEHIIVNVQNSYACKELDKLNNKRNCKAQTVASFIVF